MEIWLPRVFFSYSIFWLIPIWSIEAHHVYLFAWASKTHARGSPRWGTLHYSSGHLWPYVDGISLLSEALLAFYVNQGIQALFLLYFLSSLSLHYSSLSSLQFSRSVVSNSLQPHESQHARPPCPSPTPRVHSDSRPSSQ